jgi:arginine decarboxylase
MSSSGIPRSWSIADSIETFNIRNWGNGFFGVNDLGHLSVTPARNDERQIDMKELVDEVAKRGIGLPLLIRFSDILRSRVVELNEAFKTAMAENGYQGQYRGVYPIKVNQDRYLVEQICKDGRPYHYGLEAGSKPELLAVMAMLDDDQALVICNGYKDEEYIDTALMMTKMGKRVILVVEKLTELPLIAQVAKKVGVEPMVGIRAKLSTRGAGKWEASGGDRSKFGLSAREMLEAIRFMKENDILKGFKLLHFHLGSQISAIRSVKEGLREAGRFYVELVKAGAPLEYLDVGGGLGVDYDGTQTNFSSSMNYSMQEYANDVIFAIGEICAAEKIPHPNIVSESGRAVVAHHSVLVVDVLGTGEFKVGKIPDTIAEDAPKLVRNLFETYRDVTTKNMIEAYHDVLEYKDECLQRFGLGAITLEQRVLAEDLFWATCQKVLRMIRDMDQVPEELDGLEKALSDTYFCNFSMFQSLPDSWAIDQLFPIAPIHRLKEEPLRRAVLADITCDSDGKIDAFIGRRDVKPVLELHNLNGDAYHLGIFLVGAYQEILGDLHNLFGNTNTVYVTLGESGGYLIDHVIEGDTVNEVLAYVQYNRDDLLSRTRRMVEGALRNKRISLEDSRQILRKYEEGLSGYTYLERD